MRLLRRKGKRTDSNAKIELERVIGLTTTNASGLASNAATGDIAYLAGSIVVVYSSKTNSQIRFLSSRRTPKALSCVAYSYQGGKFIAAGESGYQPAVLIWDSISGQCLTELKMHKIGVSCIEFSPNGKHLVSVGVPHDGFLCLWEWRSSTLLCKSRATTTASPIYSVRFASDASFFITAGTKHLRQWSISQGTQIARTRANAAGIVALEGRAVNLGSQKDGSFVSISCARSKETSSNVQPIYVLTTAGVLCLLHFGVAVEKWVDLKVRNGFDLAVSETHVACACSDGIVRFFLLGNLAYTATLPRPSPFGFHGSVPPSGGSVPAVFPDALACSFLPGGKFAVVYADHSLYIWDIRNFSKIELSRTFLGHSGCVWDVASVRQPHNLSEKSSKAGKENLVDEESFITCSTDGSIRIWSVDAEKEGIFPDINRCKNMVGVVYEDVKEHRKQLCDRETNSHTRGFRAISTSSDGKYLAAGDHFGNLRVYDLRSLDLLSFQEAHDAEILSLSFGSSESNTVSLLASGGRDRLVHLYDVTRSFQVIETLDDHSASITRVKFASGVSKLLSSSADKSVVFRQVETSNNGTRSSRYHQELAPRGTIYDMDVHPNEKFAVTVGQDKKVNILNMSNGKPVRCIKPEMDVGEPIKVKIDPSGTFMICSHSDKVMRLYDFSSGEILAHASGHSEVITGLTWLRDCKHLVSVSGDSCIFVWKLPAIMSRTMRRKLVSQAEALPPPRYVKSALKRSHIGRLSCRNTRQTSISQLNSENGCLRTVETVAQENEALPTFKFSVSRLPSWAQSKVEEETSESTKRTPTEKQDGNVLQSAESRWVERVGDGGYRLATEAQEETPPAVIHVSGFGARRRFSVEASAANQDSTPESSSNSQTDGSPMSSPRNSPRPETQWKTVHTVFFDEADFIQGEGATHYNPVFSAGSDGRQLRDEPLERISSCTIGEDGVVVYLDNADPIEMPKHAVITSRKIPGNQLASDLGPAQVEECRIDVSKREPICNASPYTSAGDESDGCDDNFSPSRDLFTTHFDNLSSVAKVNSSARSSLSARFFAQNISSSAVKTAPKQLSPTEEFLEDDDMSVRFLTAERERLKLQQRQDKMAAEVQRMRDRLVTLGVAVCEGAKPEELRHLDQALSSSKENEPVKCSSAHSDQENDCSPSSSLRQVVTDIEAPSFSDTEPEREDIKDADTPRTTAEALLLQETAKFSPAGTPRPGCLPRPEGEYVAALEALQQASANALKLLSELESAKLSPSSSLTKLTRCYQNALPGAFMSMQRLADQVTELQLAKGEAPLEGMAASARESAVDIEGLLERYSVRLSESLANHVLALLQKGLTSETK